MYYLDQQTHNVVTIISISYSTPTCCDVFTSSSESLLLYSQCYKINKINKFKLFTHLIVADYQYIVIANKL